MTALRSAFAADRLVLRPRRRGQQKYRRAQRERLKKLSSHSVSSLIRVDIQQTDMKIITRGSKNRKRSDSFFSLLSPSSFSGCHGNRKRPESGITGKAQESSPGFFRAFPLYAIARFPLFFADLPPFTYGGGDVFPFPRPYPGF